MSVRNRHSFIYVDFFIFSISPIVLPFLSSNNNYFLMNLITGWVVLSCTFPHPRRNQIRWRLLNCSTMLRIYRKFKFTETRHRGKVILVCSYQRTVISHNSTQKRFWGGFSGFEFQISKMKLIPDSDFSRPIYCLCSSHRTIGNSSSTWTLRLCGLCTSPHQSWNTRIRPFWKFSLPSVG